MIVRVIETEIESGIEIAIGITIVMNSKIGTGTEIDIHLAETRESFQSQIECDQTCLLLTIRMPPCLFRPIQCPHLKCHTQHLTLATAVEACPTILPLCLCPSLLWPPLCMRHDLSPPRPVEMTICSGLLLKLWSLKRGKWNKTPHLIQGHSR